MTFPVVSNDFDSSFLQLLSHLNTTRHKEDVSLGAVGGGTHIFPHISSLTDTNSTDGKYGNLGMDFFRAFDEVVINMNDMFVRMIKKGED